MREGSYRCGTPFSDGIMLVIEPWQSAPTLPQQIRKEVGPVITEHEPFRLTLRILLCVYS